MLKSSPIKPRRVVVTGLGMISPLGMNINECFNSALNNDKPFQSNVDKIYMHNIKSKYGAGLPMDSLTEDFTKEHGLKMNVSH